MHCQSHCHSLACLAQSRLLPGLCSMEAWASQADGPSFKLGSLSLLSHAFGGCRHARQRYPTLPATLHCPPLRCGTSATSPSVSWSLGCAPLPCSTMRVTATCESKRCACQTVVLLGGSSLGAAYCLLHVKFCGLAVLQLSGQLGGILGQSCCHRSELLCVAACGCCQKFCCPPCSPYLCQFRVCHIQACLPLACP